MGWISLLALAVALGLDSFAVAVVTALALREVTTRHLFRLSFHFGLFQTLMLALGWLFGRAAYTLLSAYDHWIAFGLLTIVGGRMIWGALRNSSRAFIPDPTRGWDLVLLSVATSIDALAVGVSLAIVHSRLLLEAVVVGIVAAGLTSLGMAIGRRIGHLWGERMEALGGCVLIGIGLRVLWQHIGE